MPAADGITGGRRLKVVHVVVAGDIGGAERFLVDLARRPERSAAEHRLALMTPNPRLREMFKDAGLVVDDRGPVRADPLSYLWRAFGPRDIAWLTGVIETTAADIVHVHTYASHILGVRAAIRCGLPVLRTEHGIQHYTDPSCALFRRWALRHTDRVVGVSDYVARFVRQWAPKVADRVSVVRNGVDAGYFHAAEPPSDGPFTFALVCRLEPWKQADMVIAAVARVPGIRVRIAGSGSAEQRLRAQAQALGVADRVDFLGYLADPRPVIAASHAAINSSRDEPLGLSVLEALAMCRPVVAFSGGGIPEIVQDGETGWLVRERNIAALAKALARAAADPSRAAALGMNARRFVENEATIERMCEGYRRVYAGLVSAAILPGSPRGFGPGTA